ncbi:hypothetical protein VPH35_002444 [Triticum aestivum]
MLPCPASPLTLLSFGSSSRSLQPWTTSRSSPDQLQETTPRAVDPSAAPCSFPELLLVVPTTAPDPFLLTSSSPASSFSFPSLSFSHVLSLSQVHERRHGRCLEFLPLPKTRPRSDPPPRTRSRPPPLLPLLCFEEEDVAASIHVSASLRVDTAVTWAAWLALLPTEPSRPIFSSPSTQPPACLYPLCRRAKAHGCRCR